MHPPIIITIDGPAGAGKSTTARRVAEQLGYTYIDTGAMYRAVTLAAIRSRTNLEEHALEELCSNLAIKLTQGPQGQRTLLNDEDVTDAVRDASVTSLVSKVSSFPAVRRHLVQRQREIGLNGGVVMDGRDIGSVVFPNAQVKIFLVADLEARTRRRMADEQAKGISIDEATLKDQIALRDKLDSERAASPLIKPEGAVEIDTTNLTIDEQVNTILELVHQYHTTYGLISAFGKF